MKIEYKSSDEVIQVTFPYATEIGTGNTIDATVVTVTLLQGADASPASILSGNAQIAGSEARQLVRNGVAGCRYKVHCLATLSDTRKLARDYYLEILAP